MPSPRPSRPTGQRPSPADQCGDVLARDRLGNWTYQFAVTVDDMRHGVDLVVRGEDLLESAGRQIRLARMLGRSMPPQFLHLALIRRPGGEKFSKSSGDTGIRELRAKGLPPSEVIGRAAFLSGLSAEERGLDPGELPAIIAAALEA